VACIGGLNKTSSQLQMLRECTTLLEIARKKARKSLVSETKKELNSQVSQTKEKVDSQVSGTKEEVESQMSVTKEEAYEESHESWTKEEG